MNNRERLIELMLEHKLDRLDIAELCRAKRDEVDRWLLPMESHHNEPMPDMALELLELKLQQRTRETE